MEASRDVSAWPLACFGSSLEARRLRVLYQLCRRSPLPVLLEGPSGVGKRHWARSLVEAGGAFVSVDGRSRPEHIFGYSRAFSGRSCEGLLAQADGGVLFLKDLEQWPRRPQRALLRVLEGKAYRRYGEDQERRPGFRVVASCQGKLTDLALRHRLAGLSVSLPSLSQRREDLPSFLAVFFEGLRLTEAAYAWLLAHDWPGQLPEMRRVAESCRVLMGAGKELTESLLERVTKQRLWSGYADFKHGQLVAEARFLEQRMLACRGRHAQAASSLGLSRHALARRLKALGLK